MCSKIRLIGALISCFKPWDGEWVSFTYHFKQPLTQSVMWNHMSISVQLRVTKKKQDLNHVIWSWTQLSRLTVIYYSFQLAIGNENKWNFFEKFSFYSWFFNLFSALMSLILSFLQTLLPLLGTAQWVCCLPLAWQWTVWKFLTRQLTPTPPPFLDSAMCGHLTPPLWPH